MNRPAIVFAGTPDFALASLEALVDADYRPSAVYTQPDRPAGRGKKLSQSPVKQIKCPTPIEALLGREVRGRWLFLEAAFGPLRVEGHDRPRRGG